MAKKKRKPQTSSQSLLDPSLIKDFFQSPAGRQLLADIVMAAAGAAAAALLASNKGGKAMGKAAITSAQSAVMGVVSNAILGSSK